jgi:hypothetical protein
VLSFGGQDNGEYTTVDGGATWSALQPSSCGDCGDWFSDVLHPTWVTTFNRSNIRVYSVGDSLVRFGSRTTPFGVMYYQQTGPVPTRTVIQTLPVEAGALSVSPRCDSRGVIQRDVVWVEDLGFDGATRSIPWLIRSSDPTERLASRMIRPLPVNSFGVQTSGGHTNTIYYVWNNSNKSLLRFREGSRFQYLISPTSGRQAETFFVNPYLSNEVWIVEDSASSGTQPSSGQPGVKRWNETNQVWDFQRSATVAATDGGKFTLDCGVCIAGFGCNCPVNDMLFVPGERTRFIAGKGGVFFTLDGESWRRLFSTDQIAGIPWHMAFDRCSTPGVRSLYVSFLGRGVLRFDNLPAPPSQTPMRRHLDSREIHDSLTRRTR